MLTQGGSEGAFFLCVEILILLKTIHKLSLRGSGLPGHAASGAGQQGRKLFFKAAALVGPTDTIQRRQAFLLFRETQATAGLLKENGQGRCGPQEQHSVDFRSIHTFMKQYPIKRTINTDSPVRQKWGTPAMLLLSAFPAPLIFCPENHCPFRGFSS